MKKIFISLASLALIACGEQSKNVVVEGTVSDINAKEIVLVDRSMMKAIDTIAVEQGKFSFELDASNPTVINIKTGNFYTYFVSEPGSVTVDLGKQSSAKGTPLTDALQEYISKSMELDRAFNNKVSELSSKYLSDKSKYKEELYKYYAEVRQPAEKELNERVFNANKTNVLGAFIYLSTHSDVTVAQIDSFCMVNPAAKYFKNISDRRISILNLEKTDVGKKFVDFKARNIENTKDVNFSDIVGKGKYVLVDFWASWCGPCKAEIPYIKKIYDKHGKNNLVVLGVNVWDSHSAAVKCVEDHKMVWDHLYASGSEDATTFYGISGIPTIILFAPDGTIVDRTFRGDEMVRKMDEYLRELLIIGF